MGSGIDHLASVIEAHLRQWGQFEPFVELETFESKDAAVIARYIDAFCVRHLNVGVAEGLFYQSSIGSVAGLALADGRRVVLKVHQPNRPVAFLEEVLRVQSFLAARGLFAPAVLAGLSPLGAGHADIQQFVDIGSTADAHRPEIRCALVQSFHAIIAACAPLVSNTSLRGMDVLRTGEFLWPTPHSKLFDFETTVSGAEWIDDMARLARARMEPAGRYVIGHGDWRQEQVRLSGTRVVAGFDWDSLCLELEPALVGSVIHGFCVDWTLNNRPQAPTFQEARAFVGDYETARGAPLSASERRLCAATFTFACAYTSRCGHSLGADDRNKPGTFQHLLWTERSNLLDL